MGSIATPKNPEFSARAAKQFALQPMMAHLGATMPVIEPGYVEIHMPYDACLTQQHGYVHGGALATIADSAAGFAAFTLMAEDQQPLTVEYKLNTLRPAIGELFVAKARVLKAGRTLTVVDSDVFARRGGDETLCLRSLQTIIGLSGRTDAEALIESVDQGS